MDLCDRYVVILEVESSLQALVRGPVRECNGVYREVESDEQEVHTKQWP